MKKIAMIAGVSFITGAIFFALTFGYFQKSTETGLMLGQRVAKAESIKITGLNFAPLVKKVRPAVVKVISESIIERRRSLFGDDLFDRFFNIPSSPEKVSGIGSGFFVSDDGYILTNNHVVKNAVKVKIITIGKKEYKAKIIGKDPKTDLALLKIKAKNLPFLELGDSHRVEVGEWVLAIGNPFYQDLSVTAGIISAKGRQLGAAEYEDFLQTDAAINRGNSGGPLINMEGKVIGINSVIIAPGGGNVGVGFAIPSDMGKKVMRDLKTKGRVVRGWLGVSIQELSEDDAKEFDLPVGGIIVVKVEEGSPAQSAGLKKYDLIVAVNGKKVTGSVDLKIRIAEANPGEIVELTVYQENKKKVMKVKVGEAPDSIKYRRGGDDKRSFDLGMTLIKNNPSIAREYELKTSKGLLVRRVTRGSIASENSIKPGDVIVAVNRTELKSVNQFRSIISEKAPGSSVFLYLNRFGNEFFLKFTLPE